MRMEKKKKNNTKNLADKKTGTISLLTQYLKQPLLSSFFIHSHVAVKGRLSLFSFHRASIFHGINANALPTMNNEDRKEQNESNQIDATEPAPTSPRRWHPSCLSIVVIQRRRCRSAGVSQWSWYQTKKKEPVWLFKVMCFACSKKNKHLTFTLKHQLNVF